MRMAYSNIFDVPKHALCSYMYMYTQDPTLLKLLSPQKKKLSEPLSEDLKPGMPVRGY